MRVRDFTDEQILNAVDARSVHFSQCANGRTYWVLNRLMPYNYSVSNMAALRRRLKKLETQGLVARHPRYSYDYDIFWVRTGE